LIIGAFTHLALSQVRNVPLWAVLVGPLLAYYLQAAVPRLQAEFPRFSYRRRPVRGRIGGILNLTLLGLALIVYVVEGSRFDNATALRQAEVNNYPAGAVSYMRSHQLPRRVYVSYGWGGYLLWNLFPQYSDYMDSRADTLYNTAILHGYLKLYAAAPDWKSVVNTYGINAVLVERYAPIVQVLSQTPGWRLAYRDKISALVVRTDRAVSGPAAHVSG
jgi:hypothetical protein